MQLSHIGICVSDAQRSLEFYRDLLGFSFVFELELEGEPAAALLQLKDLALHATYLVRDGVTIELLFYRQPGHVAAPVPRPMNQLGLTHLSFKVNDLAETEKRLREAGVAFLDQTRLDLPKFGAAAIFVTDPDGTMIELVQQAD